MIVYRPQDQVVSTMDLLGSLCEKFRRVEQRTRIDHSAIQEILIDFGELEAGIADALCPEFDFAPEEMRVLRRAAHFLGHVFYRTWRDLECGVWLRRFGGALADAAMLVYPSHIRTSVPEGYAYYGLYPETFSEAAVEYMQDVQPHRVVCIGIRSIGTSLSAVVAGTLEELGCKVRSYTVRPHGHPFDRKLTLADAFEEEWRTLGESHVVIVDEGPGLSGSSFASVAEKLTDLGVAEERIAIFPSWEAPVNEFINHSAREIWQRHRKYVTEFESVWFENGRLKHPLSSCELRDISAGAWRPMVYRDEDAYPAAQPQHEMRKYLAGNGVLLKFAGLGKYGERKLEKARALSDEGFIPRTLGFTAGFLASEWVGMSVAQASLPVATGGATNLALLNRMAEYLAFRKRAFPAQRSLTIEELCGMIVVNSTEALGDNFPGLLKRLGSYQAEAQHRPATAVDGRMMRHEWLPTDRGYLKADALDHHADHFFPGCADIAWDLAGTCIEFQMETAARDFFLDRYRMHSGDNVSDAMIEFYTIAYLAFRIGYSRMAADVTSGTRDHERFGALQLGYTCLLKSQLAAPAADRLVLV